MAEWHLKELREALERRGWRFVAEHEGDSYSISASWEFIREANRPPLFIDFEGLDDMNTLSIDESYGCRVRGVDALGFYFGRKGTAGSSRRSNWLAELSEFVEWIEDFRLRSETITDKE